MQVNPTKPVKSDLDCIYSHWGDCSARKVRLVRPTPVCNCSPGDPLCGCLEPAPISVSVVKPSEEEEGAAVLRRLKDDAAWNSPQ